MAEKPPTVRQKIDEVISDMIAKNQATVPSEPAFTAGGADLNTQTGTIEGTKPQTPEFTEGQTQTEPAAQGKTAQELLAEHKARIAGQEKPDGKTAETPQAQTAPQAQAQPEPPAPAEKTQAAEAVAQQIIDELAEFEFEDPDLSTDDAPVKYKVKVPKQFLETAKRGYGRRAAYDRAIRYLKDAEPVFKQWVETGAIRDLIPLIQLAQTNEEFRAHVAQVAQRAQQGLPLIEQAQAEAAAASAYPQYQQQFQPFLQQQGQGYFTPQQVEAWRSVGIDPNQEDPFFLERIAPLLNTTTTLQQRLDAIEAERNTVRQNWQAQQQQSQRIAQERMQAHRDLASVYPDRVNVNLGPNDPFYQQAIRLAQEAGYIAQYGERAGIVFGAQQAYQIEQERLAATSSPAAEQIRQAEELKLNDLARQQAAESAKLAGGGTTTPAPRPSPPPPPSTFYPNGQKKPASVFLQEQAQYLAATGVIA